MSRASVPSSNRQSTALDVESLQTGQLYAKALLGATEAAGNTAAVVDEFNSVVEEVITPYPETERLLGSAFIAHEEKVRILDRLFAGKVSPLLLNFFKVLSGHGRLGSLKAVHRAVQDLYDEMQGRRRVEVRAAQPLSAALEEQIRSSVRRMIGAEPILQFELDPEILGGVVLRVGDRVYDGSIATQLKHIRQKMIDRSVHEIQSRRDRFSSAERD